MESLSFVFVNEKYLYGVENTSKLTIYEYQYEPSLNYSSIESSSNDSDSLMKQTNDLYVLNDMIKQSIEYDKQIMALEKEEEEMKQKWTSVKNLMTNLVFKNDTLKMSIERFLDNRRTTISNHSNNINVSISF